MRFFHWLTFDALSLPNSIARVFARMKLIYGKILIKSHTLPINTSSDLTLFPNVIYFQDDDVDVDFDFDDDENKKRYSSQIVASIDDKKKD